MSKAREYFEDQLSRIANEEIREFTAKMLDIAPEYFFVNPSSSSGKYHPPQSQGHGGLLRHTKITAMIASDLCSTEDITGDTRDAIISAALLHDICKYGFPETDHTVYSHDYIGAFYINAKAKSMQLDSVPMFREILSAVANHYGRWTKRTPGCPQIIKKYPEEFTVIDRIVHLADYVASRKYLQVEGIEEAPSLIG